MRSLFAKVLLWFLAAMTLTVVSLVATTAFTMSTEEHRRPPFTSYVDFQLEEARRAYEAGGREQLVATLRRFGRTTKNRVMFLDNTGIDLVSGLPESKVHFPSTAGDWLRPPLPPIRRATADHKYEIVVNFPPRRLPFWFLGMGHLWILGPMVLMCYGLALHLSKPVRTLQQAAARLGQGDLSVRANLRRRDELGQLAVSFNDMAGRIETLLTAERRLLQDISHELRSPLARLNVAVELARSGEDVEGALNRIEKESNRLNEMIAQVLQMTRAEGDPAQFQEPLRLDRLVQDLVEDSRIEARARGCSLEVEKCDAVEMHGNSELLRRAVENVVRNAIHYAPSSTSIVVSVEKHGDSANVQVRDFGSGVPESELGRIFDPFYRVEADRNRRQGGVGLGLAIVRRAIELHKGRILARNANPGLLVQLVLPLTA